jgi:hypothetical protein
MDTNSYLSESKTRLAKAQETVEGKQAERNTLDTEIDKLQRQIGALKILIAQEGGTAAIHTVAPENTLGPESSESQEISETGTREMIMSVRRPSQGPGMPDRRPEFQQGTLREAITSIITIEPVHGDVLANLIWQLTSQSELSTVKRSLNSELSRMRRDGVINQTALNTFRLAVGEGGDSHQY